MITDFLKYHNIPNPPHLASWDELDYVRILRFKGPLNSSTLPQILEFKKQLRRAGLQIKNIIIDAKLVTDVDSAAIAALLTEMQDESQKIGLININSELKSYLEIFHLYNSTPIFDSEQNAIAALDKEDVNTHYLPQMKRLLMKSKSMMLLIALIIFIIALPFFEGNLMGIFYLIFFTFMLLAGIYAVSYNMRHVAGGMLLAAPTLVTAWSNIFIKDVQILNAEMVFLIIFLVYTITIILRHVLSTRKITINELYSALCVYIMIGMTFGVIYGLLYSLSPGAIGFPPEETQPKLSGFFYFSFVSMSSTGFSGITAVSAIARSVVIVQVIIGIMYISVLMGKLASALSDEDQLAIELESKLKTEEWKQQVTVNFFRQHKILLILSMTMLNYACSVLMTVLHLPFFLDSWGTSLAVMLAGVWPGIFAGIIYNLAMAFTFWEPSYWVWMFSNILMAILTSIFLKLNWITLHKPLKLLTAGIIMGVLNSGMVWIIANINGLPIYDGTLAVYHFFMKMGSEPALASIGEKIAVEIVDKSIALILSAVAVIFIHDLLNLKTRKKIGTAPN